MTTSQRGYVLVVTVDAGAAPTALFFGELARARRDTVRVVEYRRDAIATLLGGASAVIFVRGLFEFDELLSASAAAGIPRYYFVDDNFIVIRENGGAASRFVIRHSEANVRSALAGFAGVLVATESLVEDFRRRGLHPRLQLFPPTAIAAMPAEESRPCRIAFFGGEHLRDVFAGIVMPAVGRFARDRDVTLVAVGVNETDQTFSGLTIERWPYYPSYLEGVRALAASGITMLVHPSAMGLANNAFKNPHALITANAIGAVPIVSNVAPYEGLEDVALLCQHSAEDWYRALVEAAEPPRAAAIRSRLADYCASAFSGAVNRAIIDELLARGAPGSAAVTYRSAIVMLYQMRGYLARAVNRVRRIGPGRGAAAVA